MARGEGRTAPKPEGSADFAPPLLRTVSRLMALIGGLRGPGYRLRLWAALGLTLVSKVLAVVSPLVLADGINALTRGDAGAALALAGQALAVNRGRNAREETANSLRLQAEARIRQKEFAAALVPLGDALLLDKSLGLPERIEQDLRFLAEAHAGLGREDEARALSTRAARVARQELKVD
mgnify:CR=1 FL=1